MIVDKVLKLANKIGLEYEDLADLSFTDAMMKIEETMDFWKEIEGNGKTFRQD